MSDKQASGLGWFLSIMFSLIIVFSNGQIWKDIGSFYTGVFVFFFILLIRLLYWSFVER